MHRWSLASKRTAIFNSETIANKISPRKWEGAGRARVHPQAATGIVFFRFSFSSSYSDSLVTSEMGAFVGAGRAFASVCSVVGLRAVDAVEAVEAIDAVDEGREVDERFSEATLELTRPGPLSEARSLFGGGPMEPSTDVRCDTDLLRGPDGVGVPNVFGRVLLERTGFFPKDGFSLDSLERPVVDVVDITLSRPPESEMTDDGRERGVAIVDCRRC